MAAEEIFPNDPAVPAFTCNDVLLKSYSQHRHLSYADAMFSHMDVMADIISTISENMPKSEVAKLPSTADHLIKHSTTLQQTSIFDKLYAIMPLFTFLYWF